MLRLKRKVSAMKRPETLGTRGSSVRLFVYGTLLPDFEGFKLIEPYLLTAPVPGRVRGRLVDAGAYPALLLGETKEKGNVKGLWYEIRREALAELDAYEEFHGIEEPNDYERVWVSDAERPEVSGWAYVWADSRGLRFASADFWPDVCRRRRRD
ncbi:gamma-glutamylcyclotransferase family protein [Cohnella laeviribosi]|uniref:gamma-glutamylcyclotransferase family protein n=1 Tax=Cohnella laeviribosi TaxID=380174 RepID=UPI0003644B07|nr:gamma-glutamylcyclotransferase family protein [Cohnella laeviribosi]